MRSDVARVFILCLCIPGALNRDFTQQDLNHYRDRVVHMFQHAYNGYLKYAYPYDELRPLTCDGHDTWGSYSLTLVDALDTLAIMGNFSEFRRVAKLLESTLNFEKDINVSVFETNIRVVGGLLSAHLFSMRAGAELEPGWPCTGPLLRMAEKVARKLLPAFNTSTGMPFGTVNLLHGVPTAETTITCTAGVGTFMVEFGALSKLTGDPIFEQVALKAMDALWESRSSIGLLGNHINVATGKWTALDSGIGAGVDSYFEYLVKGSMLFQLPKFMDRFYAHVDSIEQYMKREDWYMWAHMTKGTITLPVFQSLEAFWPGLQSLIGEIDKGMRTIHNYHQVWRQYGFTPEFYNIPKFETQSNREGYPLRPEFIESAMYLYQATKDPYLLEIGVDILESIEHSARTSCGYATVKDVRDHRLENRMESFFLAETTKYLYLLFDTNNFIHNSGGHGTVINTPNGECIVDTGGYVFNTEAHPVDGAALYCCSAQKKQDDLLLLQLHENVDLLSLLELADSKRGIFGKSLHKKGTKRPAVRLKSMKHDTKVDIEQMGPPKTPGVFKLPAPQQVIVGVPSEGSSQKTEETETSSKGRFTESKRKVIEELSKALKGTSFENLDAAVGDILKAIDDKITTPKPAEAVEKEESHNMMPPNVDTTTQKVQEKEDKIDDKDTEEEKQETENDGSTETDSESEEDAETCSSNDENRLWEIDPSEAARQMFLLTCPARPFSARFSIHGEFMPLS